MTKCKKCEKEFEYPAYVKYTVNLGFASTFYTPACPYCLKSLYIKILDKKVEKHEDVVTETQIIEKSDVGSLDVVLGPDSKLDKSKSST